jgi:hypothetical protein
MTSLMNSTEKLMGTLLKLFPNIEEERAHTDCFIRAAFP